LCLRVGFSSNHQYANPSYHIRLLRMRSERPRDRRAAEQRDELAPFQLIESHSVPHQPGQIEDIELAVVSQRASE
jgi:hypothetical protein